MEQLWISSTAVVCCEIGYLEARAALGAAHRARRVTAANLRVARSTLEDLWAQLDVVPVTTTLIRQAADLSEAAKLRGYDAIHLAAALLAQVDTFASSDARSARGVLPTMDCTCRVPLEPDAVSAVRRSLEDPMSDVTPNRPK